MSAVTPGGGEPPISAEELERRMAEAADADADPTPGIGDAGMLAIAAGLDPGRAPTLGDLSQAARATFERNRELFAENRPHRFANALGNVGQTAGGLAGLGIATLFDDNRSKWLAFSISARIAGVGPSIAGFLIDKPLDVVTGARK